MARLNRSCFFRSRTCPQYKRAARAPRAREPMPPQAVRAMYGWLRLHKPGQPPVRSTRSMQRAGSRRHRRRCACGSDPPGVLVWRCRRGTRRLPRNAEAKEPGASAIIARPRASGWLATQEAAIAPAIAGELQRPHPVWVVSRRFLPPAFVGRHRRPRLASARPPRHQPSSTVPPRDRRRAPSVPTLSRVELH